MKPVPVRYDKNLGSLPSSFVPVLDDLTLLPALVGHLRCHAFVDRKRSDGTWLFISILIVDDTGRNDPIEINLEEPVAVTALLQEVDIDIGSFAGYDLGTDPLTLADLIAVPLEWSLHAVGTLSFYADHADRVNVRLEVANRCANGRIEGKDARQYFQVVNVPRTAEPVTPA